jgi:hypothetical protein
MAFARDVADRVIFMDDVEEGNPDDVIGNLSTSGPDFLDRVLNPRRSVRGVTRPTPNATPDTAHSGSAACEVPLSTNTRHGGGPTADRRTRVADSSRAQVRRVEASLARLAQVRRVQGGFVEGRALRTPLNYGHPQRRTCANSIREGGA